jgi:hypothetical protein
MHVHQRRCLSILAFVFTALGIEDTQGSGAWPGTLSESKAITKQWGCQPTMVRPDSRKLNVMDGG